MSEETEIADLEIKENLDGDDLLVIEDSVGTYATTLTKIKDWLKSFFVGLTEDLTIYGTKTFDESPLLPTPATGDKSKKGATTEFVQEEINKKTLPDYENATTILSGSTIAQRGWVKTFVQIGNGRTATLSINGIEVWRQYIVGDRGAWGNFTSDKFEVTTGDVVTGNGTITFYPQRTV